MRRPNARPGAEWREGVRETAVVARHEFTHHLRRRTFLFTTFFLPVVGLAAGLLMGGTGAVVARGVSAAFDIRSTEGGPVVARRIGYVDPGGFVQRHPPAAAGTFIRFESVAAARQAVLQGSVEVAYALPQDYPVRRDVVRMAAGLQTGGPDSAGFVTLLRSNIWPEGSESEIDALAAPGRRVDLALDLPRYRVVRGNPIAILVPLLLGVLLYSSIFTVSSFLLQSITSEKESRVLEVLLTSARPATLLAGKVAGLGALGLLQVAVWLGFGVLLLDTGLSATAAAAGLQFAPHIAVVAGLYFVLGYFFFASLMGAIGALAPSMKESSVLTFVIVFPAWLPFFALETLLTEPNGTAARLMTLLPPTAPMVAMIRVISGPVPVADLALSLVIMCAASAVVLALAARVFQVQLLLSASLPSPGALWSAVRGRSPA